ncbi:UNVERIFIED_CONTAM: hypothetical protein FKN15_052507 [Acipenser sinensis]
MEGSALHNELKVYAAKRREPLDSYPLAYWKHFKDSLPLLAQLSHRFFCVPATSVESERLFSKAEDLITDQRTRLISVEKIILINRNLSWSKD